MESDQIFWGYSDFPRQLFSGPLVSGDVIWKDKIGGEMVGRSVVGIHNSRPKALSAVAKYLAIAIAEEMDRITDKQRFLYSVTTEVLA